MFIGFLIYPGVTQLDFTGPAQLLSQMPRAEIVVAWKNTKPVPTDSGFSINPTHAFEDVPPLDMICVPGGPGQGDMMDDEEVLSFLRHHGDQARYVTSVCTGSLLLAKAGLLDGYAAGCHWAWREKLSDFGARPVDERVVVDRNRITGGGVTAGIDFALTMIAEIAGERTAKGIQLAFEYDPTPPFSTGSPKRAGFCIRNAVKKVLHSRIQIV
ncbi:MAG: DJ-1/PfpI family protein [Myxococcota bacterium]